MDLDLPFEILWNLLEKNSQEPHLPTLLSNSLLKEACKAEKSEFVKILVKNGSRLVFEGKNDKVNDLYILKLMIKKDYILSCYQVAGNLNQSLEQCNCGDNRNSDKSDYWNMTIKRFKRSGSKEKKIEIVQHCQFHHEHFLQVVYFFLVMTKKVLINFVLRQ